MPANIRRALLITLALVPIASAREPSIAPQIKISPITVQHTTLSNGLQIYAIEDHASPTVAVQVWYHVGSKDDPNQRSGFAHLFEHMMFKGNEHLTPDTFEQLTEDIGGENNAYTAPDVTVFHEVVPSNYLEPILNRVIWRNGRRSILVPSPGQQRKFQGSR